MQNKKTLVVCIPTRNRPDALADALLSCERITVFHNASKYNEIFNLKFVVSSSSHIDFIRSELKIVQYFKIRLELAYIQNGNIFMHENWNKAVEYCVVNFNKFILYILADRRVLTTNLLYTADYIIKNNISTLIIDHGKGWLSGKYIAPIKSSFAIRKVSANDIFRFVKYCQNPHALPSLYNCLVTDDVLRKHYMFWGSYCGGPSPDIAFTYRQAFSNQTSIFFDIPVALSNSRHQKYTRSYGSGRISSTSEDSKHFPVFDKCILDLPDCVHSQCVTILLDFLPSNKDQYSYLSLPHHYRSIQLELSYPKTKEVFMKLRKNLAMHINDTLTNNYHRFSVSSLQSMSDQLVSLTRQRWAPLDEQIYPLIDDDSCISMDSFRLLESVEIS